MTQALALKRIMEEAGHQVVAAFMGETATRPIPDFFRDRFQAPIHAHLSPVWVVDQLEKGVRPWDSFFQAMRRLPRYWRQAPSIHDAVSTYRPHLLVNFYDLIGGLYPAVYRPDIPSVALGHQFLFHHPEFRTPPEKRFQVSMIRLNNDLVSLTASLRLGLSFTPLSDLPARKIRVVPPLLRSAVTEARPVKGRHLLAYILNPGYADEIMAWHKHQSDIELHCFWDRTDKGPVHSPWEGLNFHRLHDTTFIDLLKTCRGFTCTAGFESVCEAAYLGKPVCVVPTGKHTEQLCNAMDAERAGVAIWRQDFDLSEFFSLLDSWDPSRLEGFGDWVRSGPELFVRLLEGVARGENVMRVPLSLNPSPSRAHA
jgi:uncharacterized protein (TIGR00661 family)